MLETNQIVKNQIQFNSEKTPVIYFLLRKNKIVYVGQCENGLSRISVHCFDKKFDAYYFELCKREQLNDMEAYYICKFEPVYNQTIPSNNVFKSKNQLKETLNVNGFELNKIIKEKQIKSYFHKSYFNINNFILK